MFEFKPITQEGIPKALEKVDRYRLLNEPLEAESICRDILRIEPQHQQALVMLILTLTDQFNKGTSDREAMALAQKLKDNYQQAYYKGVILERLAKASITRANPGYRFDAYEWLREAMEYFEDAIKLRPSGEDEAILRWNTCVRIIGRHNLSPRAKEYFDPPLE